MPEVHSTSPRSTKKTGQKARPVQQPSVDLIFENHFSIFLIRPASDAGQAWLDENISEDAQTFGAAIVCEPRYVGAIYEGAQADGLAVL